MDEEAEISLGPLKIWVLGRQFPDHQDFWDGNWLNVTAKCVGVGSRVEVSGAFIHLTELKKWMEDLRGFYSKLEGSVELPVMEPTLTVKITTRKSMTGRLKCEIGITGEYIAERHNYLLEIDQSYLPGLISQLATVLRVYPIKGEMQ